MSSKAKTISLFEPIQRGEQEITEVQLNVPNGNALRGAALFDLIRMDVDALAIVLPRISVPALTRQDVLNMSPANLLPLASALNEFFVSGDKPQANS